MITDTEILELDLPKLRYCDFTTTEFPLHLVFSGTGFFFSYLNALYRKHGGYLWVMTYTASDRLILPVPIARLIYCCGSYESAKDSRKVDNVHIKLYLFFTKHKKLSAVFTGSQNLVSPGQFLDLMVRVSEETFFMELFNRLWKQAK